MKELLYELYKSDPPLRKSSINDCDELPSYNTMMRKGYKLIELNEEFRQRLYNENPTKCKHCEKEIEYQKNVEEKNFCNISCSTTFYNLRKEHKTKPTCLHCDKELKYLKGKYCNSSCQSKHYGENYISDWLDGKISGAVGKNLLLSRHIKKYLRELRGTECSNCGWDARHPDDGSVLTEFDHIDGDASNNHPDNLRILCPNCHSMTSTYRARNKSSKRQR